MLPASLEACLHRLRLWWLGFGLLAGLSELGQLVQAIATSRLNFYLGHQHYALAAEWQMCLFALLLLSSYSERKSAWWLASGIISWKLWRLWVFYFAQHWMLRSISYYPEFLYGLRFFLPDDLYRIVQAFLDGVNPVSVTLYSWLYGYWLLRCLRMLRHLPSNQPLQ